MINVFLICILLTAAGAKTCPEHAAEVINDAVGKVGDVIGRAKTAVGNTVGSTMSIGTVGLSTDSMIGSLKDSVVKVEEWDAVDSPKRIGEDIKQNASVKVEEGVEEVKETVENVMESSADELLVKSKGVTTSVLRSVVSWCHLLGFSTSYGIGVWVSFVSKCVVSKCLPKQQCVVVLNRVKMVYFRSMAYGVGVALFGFVVSRWRRGVLSEKMEMFQGLNLMSALFMILINLVLLEPRATKFIAQKVKETNNTRSAAAKKLKKINAYSSTLNVSTMVVLTWHLAYIGQLLLRFAPTHLVGDGSVIGFELEGRSNQTFWSSTLFNYSVCMSWF